MIVNTSPVERAKLSPRQKVLIHAGSSGVGTVAIQLAKHLGAIVATTTSTENLAWVKRLGADLVCSRSQQLRKQKETIIKRREHSSRHDLSLYSSEQNETTFSRVDTFV